MIRTVIATLFPRQPAREFVLGFGFVSLPGALSDRRHGRRDIKRLPVRSSGKASDLSGEVSA